MRKELKKINGERQTFTGEFERYGTKINYHGFEEATILFKNIKNSDGEIVTDHIWFTVGKRIEILKIEQIGTIVQFDARVKPYEKGYVNRREYIDEKRTDYKLNNPTNLKILN